MKKIYIFLIAVVCMFCVCSCSEKTELVCDNDNCQKKVTVKYKSNEKIPKDEDLVVFCPECEKEVLAY